MTGPTRLTSENPAWGIVQGRRETATGALDEHQARCASASTAQRRRGSRKPTGFSLILGDRDGLVNILGIVWVSSPAAAQRGVLLAGLRRSNNESISMGCWYT